MQIKKISYDINIYPNSNNNEERYVLGKTGKKPLIIIGLNPSIADDTNPDMTMKKIIGFAERNKYDSFIMLNLYPQRTTKPDNIHKTVDVNLHSKNLNHIFEIIRNYNNVTILAAWGEKILIRPFLKKCLTEILNSTNSYKVKWLKIGDLTKRGHPRHPSRVSYDFGLTDFDIVMYQNASID